MIPPTFGQIKQGYARAETLPLSHCRRFDSGHLLASKCKAVGCTWRSQNIATLSGVYPQKPNQFLEVDLVYPGIFSKAGMLSSRTVDFILLEV